MTQPVDHFDVYGEYTHVDPVPVPEAIARFKKYWSDYKANIRGHRKELYEGDGAAERRKADRELWEQRRMETEICLFRSIVDEAYQEECKEVAPFIFGSAVGKFRKKSGEVVEAILFTGFFQSVNAVCDFIGKADKRTGFMKIEAGYNIVLEIPNAASAVPGDWIVKNAVGEFCPVKPDVFAATHHPIAG